MLTFVTKTVLNLTLSKWQYLHVLFITVNNIRKHICLFNSIKIQELGCRNGWETFNGQCYYYSSEKVEKPAAKRFCWEQKNEAQLLLVSNDEENDFFSRKVAQTGSKSFWLRINDQKVIQISRFISQNFDGFFQLKN